jgi:hypothetical protein
MRPTPMHHLWGAFFYARTDPSRISRFSSPLVLKKIRQK